MPNCGQQKRSFFVFNQAQEAGTASVSSCQAHCEVRATWLDSWKLTRYTRRCLIESDNITERFAVFLLNFNRSGCCLLTIKTVSSWCTLKLQQRCHVSHASAWVYREILVVLVCTDKCVDKDCTCYA